MNKVANISKSLLISFFITGVQKHLRRELQFHHPTTLMEAFAMIREYETRFGDNPTIGKNWSRNPPAHITNLIPYQSNPTQPNPAQLTRPNPNPHNPPSSIIPSLPPLLPTPPSNLLVRNLPAAELRDRCSKGLCFKCDEKWNPSTTTENTSNFG